MGYTTDRSTSRESPNKKRNKYKTKKSHKTRIIKYQPQSSDITCSVKTLQTTKKTKIEACCDTGATKSVLAENMINTLKATINTNNTPQLYTANGKLMQCIGTTKILIKPKGGSSYTRINVAIAKNLGNDKLLLSRNDLKLIKILPKNWPQTTPNTQ